jgi:hypothetical protein
MRYPPGRGIALSSNLLSDRNRFIRWDEEVTGSFPLVVIDQFLLVVFCLVMHEPGQLKDQLKGALTRKIATMFMRKSWLKGSSHLTRLILMAKEFLTTIM